jgi:DNA-binding transcriptional LysR family regulator
MQRLESWDDLRHFLAVARLGTLAAASRQLGVNQSTVLRRIAQLEESLGARLFDRQPRGYTLTSVGEDMVTLAARVEDDVLALDRAVLGADRELRGTVRITTVDEVLHRVAPHLKCFCDRYPGITLDVNTELRLFSLTRREADVAIRPGRKPTEPEIIGRKLVGLATGVYASPDYLAGRKRPRRATDLNKHLLIDFGESRANVGTSRWLRKVAPNARVVYRANGMIGQQVAAMAGLGIAVLPRFLGDPSPGLERLFAVRGKSDYSLWLLFHADLRQTARVRAFIDFITEEIEAERSLYEGTASKKR